MAVNFDLKTAQRIVAATRAVEHQNKGGTPNADVKRQVDFWAFVTGCNAAGNYFSWVSVVPKLDLTPDPDSQFIADNTASDDVFKIDADAVFAGYENAVEANGHRGVPSETVVRMSLIGYTPDGKPRYVFAYSKPAEDWVLPVHDHRDNWNGGFAFSVYHPGTSLLQQPWAI